MDVVHFDSAVDTRPYPTNLYEWLASKKCDADFVVHGVIARGPSSLMRDEKAVFTEFEVDVADTLYIKPGHRPRVPVVIIKRGGSVKLPEGLVTTVIDQLSDLHLRREYVLFLRAPKNATDACLLDEIRRLGALQIGGDPVFPADAGPELHLPQWLKQAST